MIRSRPALAALLSLTFVAAPAHARQDVFSLEGLVVTASPTPRSADAVAVHVTVLEGDDLRARGVRTVLEALRDVAGAVVVQGGSFGATASLFLRGGESDYALVLVDGVQVNQAGGAFDFSSLTTANVERIEIVRGATSALYGSDAVAGVVHVITRTGDGSARAQVSTLLGSFGRRDWAAELATGGERSGYTVSLSRTETDGVLEFNNQHVNTVLSGSARLRPDDVTDVSVALRVAERTFHFPTDGAGIATDHNAFTFGDESVLHLGVTRRLNARLEVQAKLGVHGSDGGTDDAPDGPADTLGFYGFSSFDHFRRSSLDVRAHWRLDPVGLSVGWEVEEERHRSFTESLSQFGATNAKSENERLNRGYYLHAEGTTGSMSWTAGARLEDNERFGRFATWRLGSAWRVWPEAGTRVRATLGRAIKEPTFFENFATGFAVGNPDLDPERSLSWEVGLDQDLWRGGARVRATWFDQSFGDLIQFTFAPPAAGGPNFYNVAAAGARGLELALEATRGAWAGGAAWTWLDTEVTDAGFDQGAGATFVDGQPLLRRPPHTVSAHATWSAGARASIDARVRVVGTRADRDFSTFPAAPVDLPRYSVVSLGGRFTVIEPSGSTPGWDVVVRADNLFDERYQEVFGFRAPGRGLYLGTDVRFGGGR